MGIQVGCEWGFRWDVVGIQVGCVSRDSGGV